MKKATGKASTVLLFTRWENIQLTVFVWRSPWMAHLLTQTRFRSTIESLLRKLSIVINSRRSGTRLTVRKRPVRQVPASFHGLLITNAPSRATFQSKAGKFVYFPHPMNSNCRLDQNSRRQKPAADSAFKSFFQINRCDCQVFLFRHVLAGQGGSDDGHGVGLLGVAAPGQVVDGSV